MSQRFLSHLRVVDSVRPLHVCLICWWEKINNNSNTLLLLVVGWLSLKSTPVTAKCFGVSLTYELGAMQIINATEWYMIVLSQQLCIVKQVIRQYVFFSNRTSSTHCHTLCIVELAMVNITLAEPSLDRLEKVGKRWKQRSRCVLMKKPGQSAGFSTKPSSPWLNAFNEPN